MKRSSTDQLIDAMLILSGSIESKDGVANAAILEAAQRMQELKDGLERCVTELAAEIEQRYLLLAPRGQYPSVDKDREAELQDAYRYLDITK